MTQINLLLTSPLRLLTLLLLCLLISACDNSSSGQSANHIEGRAVKGVISQGVVRAHLANDHSSLITQTRTDHSGHFSLDLTGVDDDRLILLTLSADDSTRMRCDLVEGCIESISGNRLAFG